MWKYYDITHRLHTLLNPMSEEKVRQMISILKIPEGAKVLDLGCGKGEFLRLAAHHTNIQGVGVDLSPYYLEEAKNFKTEFTNGSTLKYVEQDGREFVEHTSETFDVTICMGASWIFDNYSGTLQALMAITKPGGMIIFGEPYWKNEPSEAYLDAAQTEKEMFQTYAGNVKIGEEFGLRPIYAIQSNLDEWDKYEWLQTRAVDLYLQSHSDDPDNDDLVSTLQNSFHAYINEGRDVLGWAIYVFTKVS